MEKPLKHIDHIMWDMEMPTSLVTVCGMMVFREPVTVNSITHIVRERLLQYDKFRQKVVMKGSKPVWTEDDDFDLHAHIHRVAVPGNGSYEELQELIADLMAVPLDYSKPLWQVHLIENYEGGSAILWRIHHAIADGIALIKVVFSLTGITPAASLAPVHHLALEHKQKPSGFEHLRHRLKHALHIGEELYKDAYELIKDPAQLKEMLQNSWETTKELTRLVSDPSRRNSKYKGHLGVVKKVAWSKPVQLADVKRIGRTTTATVNDVLLAAMSGAIRRHLLKHGEDVALPFRVVCPVNFRKGREIVVENSIGMISLELPVHIGDSFTRIKAINETTSRLKHSMEPAVVFSLLNIAGDYLPRKLELAAGEHIGNRIMGVLSNVPGPKEQIYFAGHPVEDIMFWIPQTNILGVGISIISYNGKVRLGIATDANIISDPDYIMEGFQLEFDRMCSQMDKEEPTRS